MSDTDMLYMASLQKQLEAAEEKNAVLKKDIAERDVYITMAEQRLKELEPRIAELEDKHWNECRQIAHYEDELRKAKELLKAAVEDFEAIGEVHAAPTPMISPKYGDYMRAIDIHTRKWRYADEALALIGEDGEQNDT